LAEPNPKMDAASEAGRGVTRTLINGLVLIASLAFLGFWASQGFFKLQPGESAVILRLGAYDRTRSLEGWWGHLPPPLESHEVVNTSRLRTESFGVHPTRSTPGAPRDAEEAEIARRMERDAIQTADNNIVNVAYELQYKVGDALAYRFDGGPG
jgi:regulator of protease activity HflC (stomatin/prohibitin superfamily)